ncbi:hypothetical protein KEM52_005467 [Ascosphaera acerosa]|nr:hypothetical protein KEM52_005467 [Ascosphaera acerosa]
MSIDLETDEFEEGVLATFRARNVPLKRDALKLALDDQGFRAWASKYLQPDTLLSKDELDLYSHIESSAQLKVIEAQLQGQPPVRPILDEEIRAAIESLRQSTAATQQQTDILRSQCRKLREKVDEEAGLRVMEDATVKRLHEKHVMEVQRTDREIEDRINAIELMLTPAEASARAERTAVLPQIAGILKEHDRLLSYLEQSLLLDTHSTDLLDDERAVVKRARSLAELLATYTAEAVKSRLDRIYLQGLAEGSRSSLDNNAGPPAVDDKATYHNIQDEIGKLYPQIDRLVATSVRHEHQLPLMQALRTLLDRKQIQTHAEFDTVCKSLHRLTQSSEDIAGRLRSRQSYSLALCEVSRRYKADVADRPTGPSLPLAKGRVVRRKGSTVKAAKVPSEPLPEPLQLYLKQVGVVPPHAGEVAAHLQTHHAKLLQSLEADRASDAACIAMLESADTVSQSLSDALLAETTFETSLTDEAQEAALDALEADIEAVREALSDLDLDVLSGRDPARDAFLERWGKPSDASRRASVLTIKDILP